MSKPVQFPRCYGDGSRVRVVVDCSEDPPLTKQSQRQEADINWIVARFEKTGELPEGRAGLYADVSALGSYHEALNLVQQAEELFSSMPADVRTRFQNDAGVFLDHMADPANVEDARQLGLFGPPGEKSPGAVSQGSERQEEASPKGAAGGA